MAEHIEEADMHVWGWFRGGEKLPSGKQKMIYGCTACGGPDCPFDAKGDGVTDDTAAINRGAPISPRPGVTVMGNWAGD